MYIVQYTKIIFGCFDLKPKKWSHLRTVIATSGYCYLEVVNSFVNISAKAKIFCDVDLGLRYLLSIYEKNSSQKSHATVLS